jgi:hypothetical protein
MKIGRYLTLLLLLSFCGVGSAEFVFENVSEFPSNIRSAALASSPDGVLVVAWAVESEGVWTRTLHQDMVEAPVFHGTGSMPTLCWGPSGFTLAWAVGPLILIKSGDGMSWSDMEYFQTPSGENVVFPQLTAPPEFLAYDEVLLTWEERDEYVWVSLREDEIWGPAFIVSESGDYEMSHPLAKHSSDGLIRIYELNEPNTCLEYSDGDYTSGWIGSMPIWPGLGYFGTEFDTSVGPQGVQKVLSLGPQPTCPCNVIRFSEQLSYYDWSVPEDLTIHRDHYDFPEFPNIEDDSDGWIHAFWYQSFHDEMLQQSGEGLFYFTRGPNGVWLDRSAIFGDEVGVGGAMDIGPMNLPIFAYLKGEYPDRDVWIARDRRLTDASETPAPALRLSAAPNPFNPKTTLSFDLPEAGHVELAIFDLSGRRVVTLLDEHRDAGGVAVDWNGRDAAGQRLSSGVYIAKATVPGYSAVEKLVMLK